MPEAYFMHYPDLTLLTCLTIHPFLQSLKLPRPILCQYFLMHSHSTCIMLRHVKTICFEVTLSEIMFKKALNTQMRTMSLQIAPMERAHEFSIPPLIRSGLEEGEYSWIFIPALFVVTKNNWLFDLSERVQTRLWTFWIIICNMIKRATLKSA